MGQTDSVQTQTVAIVEPAPTKEAEADAEGDSQIEVEGEELDEVVIVPQFVGGEQVAPLAQEEENLSICDEDFATPEAVSPINLHETVDLFTSTSPPPSMKPVTDGTPISPASPMDKTIRSVAENINGIQRCEGPGETSDVTI